jgi:hypothetical protein
MAQQGTADDRELDHSLPKEKQWPIADPLDSAMRRKFLNFCEENPWADECRIHEL